MSWLELWLIALVATGSHGCLKCSQEGMAILKDFRDHYLYKKLRRNPELRTKLLKFMDDEIMQLPYQFVKEGKFKGVIDEFSLETLVSHFKRSLNQIKENELEGEQLFNEVVWGLQNLQATFEKMLPSFQKLYCSNECAQNSELAAAVKEFVQFLLRQSQCHMVYVLISCFSCQMNYYSCTKNFRCGERNIEVEIDDDLILDCALTWHKASHGVKRYSFFRMVHGTERLMTTGLDSFLVKKEANVNDTGRYRCKMLAVEGYTASQLDFQVKVVASVGKTTWFPRPETTWDGPLALGVSSRAPPPQEDWTAWIVIGITGGLLLILVGGFLCFYRHKIKKEEEEDGGSEIESKSSELVEM